MQKDKTNILLELKDIYKTYHMGKVEVPAINGISLTVSEGEFIAIMGHSGSGKSTLLNIIGLLDKPTSGSYKIAGTETSLLSEDEIACLRNRFLGFVFQQFHLLPRMNAKENVILPLVYSDNGQNNNADIEAKELLNKVGLGERIYHKPNELSGGQQQRVAIARALINHPLVLLADEPTGNLDTKSAAEIISILENLNRSGITIVMVTHEPDLASAANRTITLKDGKIISDIKSNTTKFSNESYNKKDIYNNYQFSKHHSIIKFYRIKNYFAQAIRSLLSNKTRSALSILGVLVGVACLIAMMALGKGAQEEVKKNISSLGSNLLMVRPSSARRGSIALESGSTIRLTMDDVIHIKNRIHGVERVTAYITGRGQVTYKGKNWNTRIEGTTPDYPYLRNAIPINGRFFTEEENISRAKICVIGQTIVKELFGDTNPLGEYIKIKRIDFQVIGVFPEKGSAGPMNQDDKISIPINTAMYRLLGSQYIDSIDVQVSDISLMEDVSERIKDLILQIHRIPNTKSDIIDIHNMADIQQTISSTTKTFSFLLGSIAFVSLLVGGIGIMNIMLVSVTERTKEIGLRKALGANNKDILFQFVIESIVICIIGGISGIILGSIISFGLSRFAKWSILISPFSIGLALLFSFLVGIIFGIWPAKKASNLNPIEALRYE